MLSERCFLHECSCRIRRAQEPGKRSLDVTLPCPHALSNRVKNAILLVDFFNQARARGTPVHEALMEAGSIRLRPILMTTLAMVFGMMPLALGLGEGASQRAPMAHAVIGGLISSTLLTLVVVPVVLVYIDRFSLWAKARFSRSADEVARRHEPAG